MDIEEKLKIIEEHFKNLPIEEFEKFLEKNLYVWGDDHMIECEYCKNTGEEIIPPELPKKLQNADDLVAYVYFNGDLDVWNFKELKQDTFLINYCPMCGRKLRKLNENI